MYASGRMATLELTTLSDKLDEDELSSLLEAYRVTNAGPLDIDDVAEQAILDNGIDDDDFVDFVDKLEANDAAADIYLPSDFEDVFEVGEFRVGSAHSLLLVLENLREEFLVDGELADDDDETEEADDVDPFVAENDDDGFYDDDDDDGDGPAALGEGEGEGDSTLAIKEEKLRHIWKLMSQGAKVAIRRGLCLFIS